MYFQGVFFAILMPLHLIFMYCEYCFKAILLVVLKTM
jgi:hypothetical protein